MAINLIESKMQEQGRGYHIEVCFSPRLADDIFVRENLTVVVVDILRATTSMIAALGAGASAIIPVSSPEEARQLKSRGFLVAAEQNGKTLDFADFGNSAFEFKKHKIRGKEIVFSTTNGTVALAKAAVLGEVVLGAFSNISALAQWLSRQNKNVLILCSGWKNTFCLEDTIFAGALIGQLLERKPYLIRCDSAWASLDLWEKARQDVLAYLEKARHRERLRRLGRDDVLEFSLMQDTSAVVPVLNSKGRIVDFDRHRISE
jgi:2-phosphosulfolactate phosphatase